ncbi:MAG: hypothetical protein IJV43_02945, partial [Oscillospiraceae bacterium]|nr:hypothetical protein [Oscillospiraceae bacterium]
MVTPLNEQDTSRSGWQTAADLARAGKAAANIARAAASSGVYGAAAAATKEAAPFLIRVILYLIVAAVVTTMAVFTAIPNIFFGYDASAKESIIQMTRQAATIGGVCMSLQEFESTVIDAIVTSIANEYEEQGIAIDHIEVISHFDTESLQWFTAINSTAHQQNLEEMSVDEIRELCAAR